MIYDCLPHQVWQESGGSLWASSISKFARLKESTAYMRGFLTGVIALPERAVPALPPRAFADLVICASNQKAYQESLRTSAPPRLLQLMAKGFTIENPELAEAHLRLMSEFDLHAIRSALTVRRCWDLYTEHVDKLQGIEAAVLSELQISAAVTSASASAAPAVVQGEPMPTSLPDGWPLSPTVGRRGRGDVREIVREIGPPTAGSSGNGSGACAVMSEARIPSAVMSIPSAVVSTPSAGRDSIDENEAAVAAVAAVVRTVLGPPAGATTTTTTTTTTLAEAQHANDALAAQLRALPAAALKRALLLLIGVDGSSSSNSPSAVSSAIGAMSSAHASSSSAIHDAPQSPVLATTSGGGAAASAAADEQLAARSRLLERRHADQTEDCPVEWRISLDDLVLHRRIGGGAMGATYLAAWEGVAVAVKVACSGVAGMAGWRAEVAALTRLRHPNIVRCLGAAAAPPTYCLVLEYCDGGDVRQALNRPTPRNFFWSVAEGVATGMAYLHRKGILHLDLKCANLLLDSGGVVRITDFGLATSGEGRAAGTVEVGTFRWMAPEVVRREAYSTSADVYSFAMVLVELITHEVPFATWEARQAAAAVAYHNVRPTLPEVTPPALVELLTRCWRQTAAHRPSFADVVQQLAAVRAALSADELAWLAAPDGQQCEQARPRGAGGAAPP